MMKNEKKLLWLLVSYNSLFYVAAATFGPYISVYYKDKGLTITQIGLLSEVGALVALFIQPLWGIGADKYNKRKQFLLVAITGAGMFVMSYRFATDFITFFVCVLLFSIFSSAIGPLGDTVVTDIAEKNSFKYSTIRMGGTVSYAAVVVLAGVYLRTNPKASFILTALMYLIMLFTVLRMPDVYHRTKESQQKRKLNRNNIWKVIKNKQISFILVYLCIFQIVLGCYGGYLSLLVTQMGYDNRMIGILMCISAVSEIPILLNLDRIIRKFGTIKVMVFAGFMMVIRIFLPSMQSIEGIILAQMLQGVTYMIMYYCTVMYMVRNLELQLHSTGQSLLCLVQAGIASLFSNVVGGYLCDRLGIIITYRLYGTLFMGVLILILLFFFYRRGKNERIKDR